MQPSTSTRGVRLSAPPSVRISLHEIDSSRTTSAVVVSIVLMRLLTAWEVFMRVPAARWIVALALVLATPGFVRAQALIAILLGDKLSSDRFQLGLNISAAGTGFSGVSNRMRISWGIGMYGEVRLSARVRLLPELVFKSPSGAAELNTHVPGYRFTPIGEPTVDRLIATGKVTRTLQYIALPVVVKGVFGPIGLGLGPEFSVLVRAQDTVATGIDQGTLKLSTSVRKVLCPVDAGLIGSIEYAFEPEKAMRSMRIRAKGYYGLVDTVQSDHGKPVRNWYLMLGADIPIGGPPHKHPDHSAASKSPGLHEPSKAGRVGP